MLYRQFLIFFCISAVTVLSLIAAGNVFFDAAGVYHFGSPKFQAFVQTFVERLPEAKYGLKYPPYERSIKIAIAEQSSAECYVTGSSRHMTIGRDGYPEFSRSCQSMTNLAVSGGTFEDLLIFFDIIAEKPTTRRLYAGIDPWFLWRKRGAGWVDFSDRYYAARRKFGIDPLSAFSSDNHLFRNLLNIFSLDYLLKSVKAGMLGAEKADSLEVVQYSNREQQVNSRSNALLPDGVLLYPGTYLAKTPPPDYLVGPGTFNLKQDAFEQPVVHEIEAVIREARRRKIQLTFVLMPYHPKVFGCGQRWVCQVIANAEAEIRRIASRNDIDVLGSYDPGKVSVGSADFLDDIHVSGDSIARALSPRRQGD